MPSLEHGGAPDKMHVVPMAPWRQGWLSLGRKRVKRSPCTGNDDSNGLSLTDDVLLHIFGRFLSMADLVRCAATCSQWRRLVSRNAVYISCSMPRLDSFVGSLAVGFFNQNQDKEDGSHEAPLFVRLGARFQQASMDWLFSKELFKSARLVACRKGRLILELHRKSLAAVLRLVVCNPMTGEVSILPPLSGKYRVGGYACALLNTDDPPCSSSGFCVVLIYHRRNFLACRSYSSDTNSWGPEGRTTGAKISRKCLQKMDTATVVCSGVLWQVEHSVFGLRLDTLETKLENPFFPWRIQMTFSRGIGRNRLLAAWPDGRLAAVAVTLNTEVDPSSCMISVMFRNSSSNVLSNGWGSAAQDKLSIDLGPFFPNGVAVVYLHSMCEQSGVIFFAALPNLLGKVPWKMCMLDLERKVVRQLPDVDDHCWGPKKCRRFFPYEMDQAAYLMSLGRGDVMEADDMDGSLA